MSSSNDPNKQPTRAITRSVSGVFCTHDPTGNGPLHPDCAMCLRVCDHGMRTIECASCRNTLLAPHAVTSRRKSSREHAMTMPPFDPRFDSRFLLSQTQVKHEDDRSLGKSDTFSEQEDDASGIDRTFESPDPSPREWDFPSESTTGSMQEERDELVWMQRKQAATLRVSFKSEKHAFHEERRTTSPLFVPGSSSTMLHPTERSESSTAEASAETRLYPDCSANLQASFAAADKALASRKRKDTNSAAEESRQPSSKKSRPSGHRRLTGQAQRRAEAARRSTSPLAIPAARVRRTVQRDAEPKSEFPKDVVDLCSSQSGTDAAEESPLVPSEVAARASANPQRQNFTASQREIFASEAKTSVFESRQSVKADGSYKFGIDRHDGRRAAAIRQTTESIPREPEENRALPPWMAQNPLNRPTYSHDLFHLV